MPVDERLMDTMREYILELRTERIVGYDGVASVIIAGVSLVKPHPRRRVV